MSAECKERCTRAKVRKMSSIMLLPAMKPRWHGCAKREAKCCKVALTTLATSLCAVSLNDVGRKTPGLAVASPSASHPCDKGFRDKHQERLVKIRRELVAGNDVQVAGIDDPGA